MKSKRQIEISIEAIIAARARGESYALIGKRYGCSHNAIFQRVMKERLHRCTECDIRAAEIERLRDAYMFMEEALLAFLGVNQPDAESVGLAQGDEAKIAR